MAKNGSLESANQFDGDKHKHNDLHHWVYVFGATLLAGVVAFVSFWKDSHFIALMLFATCIGLISVYELRTRKFSISFILGVIIGFYAIAGIASDYVPTLPEETEFHGWLLPANEATPPNACDKKKDGPIWASHGMGTPPPGALLFLAGSNAAWTTSTGKSTVLQVGNCVSISVERQDAQLAFDADIFDTSHELVARVEHNEFHLIQGKFSYQKRPNRSTLIVFDKHGDPLFVVWYLNPNTVKLPEFSSALTKWRRLLQATVL